MPDHDLQAAQAALQANDPAAMAAALEALPAPLVEQATLVSKESGNVAFRERRFADALGLYTQALAGAPGDSRVLSNRSACSLALNRPEDALRDALAAVAADPDWPKGYYRVGRALYSLDRLRDAAAQFEKGLARAEGNSELQAWLDRSRREAARAEQQANPTPEPSNTNTEKVAMEVPGSGARVDADWEALLQQVRPQAGDVVFRLDDLHGDPEEVARRAVGPINAMPEEEGKDTGGEGQTTPEQDDAAMRSLATYLERVSELAVPERQVRTLQAPAALEALAEQAAAAEGRHKLVLGAGTGVLAARAGAGTSVISCHPAPFCVATPQAIAGAGARVLPAWVEDVTVDAALVAAAVAPGADKAARVAAARALPSRADVVVVDPDLMDDGLLGRRLLPALRHAREHLAAEGAVFLPAGARVFAQPLDLRTRAACGLDLSPLDRYRWAPNYEAGLDLSVAERLAEPQEALAISFSAPPAAGEEEEDEKDLAFELPAGSVCNAVAFWFELDGLPAEGHHWQPAVQWLDPVSPGGDGRLVLRASHNGTRIRFRPVGPAGPAVERRHTVARWHLAMVNDEVRNDAYAQAIQGAVEAARARRGDEDTVGVLDIGCGSGLLSMMAARAGADWVAACDTSAHMLATARDVLEANRLASRVQLLGVDARKLAAGEHLPKPADVLIVELFDYALLGEGVLHMVHHAWHAGVLAPDAQVVPRRGRLMAMLVEMRVERVAGVDVTAWGRYRFQPDYYGVRLDEVPHRKLSEPFEVFAFDFGDRSAFVDLEGPVRGAAAADVRATADGVLNAVVFWNSLDLDAAGELRVDTGPGAARTHWLQAVQMLDEVRVSAGDVVPLKAAHDTSHVRFALRKELVPDLEERRTDVPGLDPLWLQTHQAVDEQGRRVGQMISSHTEGRKQALLAAERLALDPAAYAERLVDPGKASMMFLSFFA